MSLETSGRRITCDGAGCSAAADSPIALRPTLSSRQYKPSETIDGWLFTATQGRMRHFCPRCAALYLNTLNSKVEPAERD